MPAGTSISVRDLFFNIPARKKFLKAESTELAHIASLVTHYALAHPDKHFELHSSTNAMLVAPPVAGYSERVYQVFGKEVLDQLIPVAALQPLERIGLPQPPPWRRKEQAAATLPPVQATVGPKKPGSIEAPPRDEETAEAAPSFGELRLHGFVSKPEIQKLNRNSIYVFVNGRLIRDRLIQHAIIEAYRNILPPTVYPVVLLFIDLPSGEVDVNVHPSKTEVRFRQQIGDARFRARFDTRGADESPSGAAICGRDQRPSERQPVAGREPGATRQQAAAWPGHSMAAVAQPFSLQAPSAAAYQRSIPVWRGHFSRWQRGPVAGAGSRAGAGRDRRRRLRAASSR